MHNDFSEHAMLNFRQHVRYLICQLLVIDLTLIVWEAGIMLQKRGTKTYITRHQNLLRHRRKRLQLSKRLAGNSSVCSVISFDTNIILNCNRATLNVRHHSFILRNISLPT